MNADLAYNHKIFFFCQYLSPDFSRKDYSNQFCPSVRSSVHPFVCPDYCRITVHQFFSEILQQVVFSYLVVHCKKIFPEKLVETPGPQKGSKNPKKAPNWTKSHFLPYISSSIHQIFLKFCQNLETFVMNIKVLLLMPTKLWLVSPEAFRAKKYPFWGLF